MFEKAPDVWGWFSLSVTRVKSNSYLYWGSFTAFPAALWSGLCDKHGWCSSLFGGLLATIITLSILAVMKRPGYTKSGCPVGLIPPASLPGESAISAL